MEEKKDELIINEVYTKEEFDDIVSELKLEKLDKYAFSKLEIYEYYNENKVELSKRFFVEEVEDGNYLVHNVYNLQPEDVRVKTGQKIMDIYKGDD